MGGNKYKQVKVAVTDSSYKQTLGIVRAIGKIGVRPYILSTRRYSLAGVSKYTKKEIILPRKFEFNDLVEGLKTHSVELLILVGTDSFKKIVPWKNDLKKAGIIIITVDSSIQDLAFSKEATYKIAEKIGIPIPVTYYPKSKNELQTIKGKISFPCVIKGLYEVGGNIVDYVHDADKFEEKYEELCDKYQLNESTGLPMVQEYISGQGCAFFAIYANGKCGPTFQHKRIREYPVSGGASVCAESFKCDVLEIRGRKLLDHLIWNGVAMVEFKLNDAGDPILMEINPKFWGSTDLALESGVNFPKLIIDIYIGKEIEYSKSYKYPFRYHWPLSGDIQHVVENSKNFKMFLSDILNPNVKSNLWVIDPLPTLHMMSTFILRDCIKVLK